MPTRRLTFDELMDRLVDSKKFKFKENFVYSPDERIFYLFDEKESFYFIPDHDSFLPNFIFNSLVMLKKLPDEQNPIPQHQDITVSTVKSAITSLGWRCPNRLKPNDTNFATFSDLKVIDLDSFTISDVSRDKVSLLKFPFPSTVLEDNSIDCPNWKQFLTEVLVTKETCNDQDPTPDPQLIELMQEIFGYALLSHNKLEKTFFFFGSGQNGKSKVIQTLKLMFPGDLVSCETLGRLTTNRFATASLVGKRLNITAEEDSKFLASDIFKMMVSGEEITGERKFEGSFKFKPAAKFIFATNKIPTFDTVDEAIRRRLVIVPFFRKIPEHKKDADLFELKLKPELPGVFKWALEGAKRVAQNKKLSNAVAVEKMNDAYERAQSSAIEYFQENFEVTGNDDDVILKSKLFDGYKEWITHVGRKALSRMNFYNDLEMRYGRNGLRFPDQVVWSQKFGGPIRAVFGVTPSNDSSAWINASGWWNNSDLPNFEPNKKDIPF